MKKNQDRSDTPTESKEPASKRVIEAIRQDIAMGELLPGERLDEVKLAERLGVSRTPVREAFNQLVAQKVLTNSRGRGVRVIEFTREELAQLFEVMFEIEITCARLVARRLTFLTRSEIEIAHAKCGAAADAGDIKAYICANESLHTTIYRATGNKYMEELASEFRHRTGPFGARKFRTKDDLLMSTQSHAKLLEKIFSADSEVAVSGMRDHMEASFLRVLGGN